MNKKKRTISDAVPHHQMLLLTRLQVIGIALMMFISGVVAHALMLPVLDNLSWQENRFAPYASVLPGQPLAAVDSSGFHCPTIPIESKIKAVTCVYQPAEGDFSQVELRITRDAITRISFAPAPNHVTVADLIALWGQPEVKENERSFFLRWRDRNIFVIAPRWYEGFSPSLAVWRIHFYEGVQL